MVDLLSDALELMLAGMGVVFVFLIVLTICVTVLTRIFPPQDSAADDKAPAPAEGNSVIAAITAAVHQYRKQHRS